MAGIGTFKESSTMPFYIPPSPNDLLNTIVRRASERLAREREIIETAQKRVEEVRTEHWANARQIVLNNLPSEGTGVHGPWFGTVGDPKLRLLPRDVEKFCPRATARRWRSGITKLRKINPELVGFCVVELQLCKLLDRPGDGVPRYFFEPHFHFVLYGATKEQVKAAFKVRAQPNVIVRKRAVKIQPIHNLNGAVGYMTKARPEFRQQYRKLDGSTGWGRSKPDGRHTDKWLRVMLNYPVKDLLSSTGFSLRNLGSAGAAELATTLKRQSP